MSSFLLLASMVPFAAAVGSRLRKAPPAVLANLSDAKVIPLPALKPAQAAREFVAWLRVEGEIGQHSSYKISALYAEFCEISTRTPASENMMLGALKKVHGVTKATAKGRKRKNGKRTRPVVWTIAAVAEVKRRRA